MDCSLPSSSVHGIFQARVLEWVAFPFSRGSSQPRDWTWVSCTASRCFTIWATREAKVTLKFIWRFLICRIDTRKYPSKYGITYLWMWERQKALFYHSLRGTDVPSVPFPSTWVQLFFAKANWVYSLYATLSMVTVSTTADTALESWLFLICPNTIPQEQIWCLSTEANWK